MDSLRPLPTGVVTFVMTDIEGSTRLWEREPEAMRDALSRHDAILALWIAQRHGHVVKNKGEGDSVFAVFPHARDAVGAALVAQCALAVERWATSTPLRVRMAIHTGQIELLEGDYSGPTVNRCARLRALARGGQVLLSGVTAQLTQGQLPGGAGLRDLGIQTLKDLASPERVWQLVHPQMAVAESRSSSDATALPGVPLVPNHRAYKLTDHVNRCSDGREWGAGVTYSVSGIDRAGNDSRMRCYASPALAALLNGQHEGFRLSRVWEATVDVALEPDDAVIRCREVTTIRPIPMPTLTPQHLARFAVQCARAAYEGGTHQAAFGAWADGWLLGQDSSGVNARALADELERHAWRGSELAHPEDFMAANAARAAMHAARVSWLAGRSREEEKAQAIQLANEAVATALRMAELDLPALAEEIMPNLGGLNSAVRPVAGPAPSRILRALPT